MVEIFNVCGMREVSFKDASTGSVVSGIRFYYTMDDEKTTGVATGSFFVSSAKLASAPSLVVGSVVSPVYNRFGKIDHLEEV